ncbi:MAG TPA: polysaccharide deacetylase family protein [Gammaproteobacteria bacterium]|nr:polysaccharide deacetylase family protein [Gammaproteobacteria bacterium]
MRVRGLETLRNLASRRRARVHPGGTILMYHRIADTDGDPWGNCVSAAHFEQQLEVIRRLVNPCRLSDITDCLERGERPRGKVVLTFDDGYADNYHVARPLLHAHDTPATFFLVSNRVGSSEPYWWDELADVLLRVGRLPESLTLMLDGQAQELRLDDAVVYAAAERRADRARWAWAARSGSRLGFYYRVWKLLRPLSEAARSTELTKIRAWASCPRPPRAAPISITAREAETLVREDLIEIGSHSKSHPSLPDLSPALQLQELTHSKAALEAVAGRPVRSFAYPYGDYGRDTPGLVREAGYTSACTTVSGQVRPNSDPFLLPRIAVLDWSGDEFERRLARYLGHRYS